MGMLMVVEGVVRRRLRKEVVVSEGLLRGEVGLAWFLSGFISS